MGGGKPPGLSGQHRWAAALHVRRHGQTRTAGMSGGDWVARPLAHQSRLCQGSSSARRRQKDHPEDKSGVPKEAGGRGSGHGS